MLAARLADFAYFGVACHCRQGVVPLTCIMYQGGIRITSMISKTSDMSSNFAFYHISI
jgi:hypothetical protein